MPIYGMKERLGGPTSAVIKKCTHDIAGEPLFDMRDRNKVSVKVLPLLLRFLTNWFHKKNDHTKLLPSDVPKVVFSVVWSLSSLNYV